MTQINPKTFQGIGGRLKKIRKKLDYSLPQMAGALGLSYEGYYKNESNNASPGAATLHRLLQNFDISMDWLLFEKGPMLFKDKPQPFETLLGNATQSPELVELLTAMEQNPQLKHEILAYFYKFKSEKKSEE